MSYLNNSAIAGFIRQLTLTPASNVLRAAIFIAAASLMLQGCQALAPKAPIAPAIASSGSAQKNILVINSNANVERYRVAQQAFAESMPEENYHTIDLNDEDDPVSLLQSVLNQTDYEQIYCIGAKALGSIDFIAPEQDIVFSSVLNWRRFEGRPGMSGIASDIAPESQLAMFKYFFPDVKRLGVIFSNANKTRVKQATAAAASLGLELIPVLTEKGNNIQYQIQFLAQEAQALWLIPDPVVLSSIENTAEIFDLADIAKLPIFSTNSLFKELGSTLIVSTDLPTVGRQAAILIKHPAKGTQQVHHPVGSNIILNMKQATHYNLKLNYQALGSVNELIE